MGLLRSQPWRDVLETLIDVAVPAVRIGRQERLLARRVGFVLAALYPRVRALVHRLQGQVKTRG